MPFTDPGTFANGSAAVPLDAGFFNNVRKGLDATVNRRGSIAVTEYGAKLDGTTDDTAAIQAAINTGADVIIGGTATGQGLAKITSTLVGNASAIGQKIITNRAVIQPAFVGDGLQMSTKSLFEVAINGALQPSSGDYSNVAGIRIGSGTYNPQQGSVANSQVLQFKGSAAIWAQGSMIDFTHFHADTITYDGIRCPYQYDDNNHGWFANTHIVNAAGIGYAIYGDGSNLSNGGSRHHVFQDAKAFGCGQNYLIQTRSNEGTIFSENSTTPSSTTSSSRGNYLRINETAASFEGWVDAGLGNRIEGYSNNNAWETKNAIFRAIQIGNTALSQFDSGTALLPATTLTSGALTTVNPGLSGLGQGRTVEATLQTAFGPGLGVEGWVDGTGNLFFDVQNKTTSTKTSATAVISYIIKRFA